MCDGCAGWQHRICNTGISRDVYRRAVKGGFDIPWKCTACSLDSSNILIPTHPQAESSRMEQPNTQLQWFPDDAEMRNEREDAPYTDSELQAALQGHLQSIPDDRLATPPPYTDYELQISVSGAFLIAILQNLDY